MSLGKASKEILKARGLFQQKTLINTDAISIQYCNNDKLELEDIALTKSIAYKRFSISNIWLQTLATNFKDRMCFDKDYENKHILTKNVENNVSYIKSLKPILAFTPLHFFSKSGETDDTDEDDDSDEMEESKGGPVRQSGGRLGTLDAASEAGYFHKTDKAQLLDLKKQLKSKAKEDPNPENKE